MITETANRRLTDRLTTVVIWVLLLGASWSLPVVSYLRTETERAKVESGQYYTPKMPAEWYAVKS